MSRRHRITDSPAKLAIAVGLTVLVGEFLIMLLMDIASHSVVRSHVPGFFWKYIDPVLLAAIVSPAIYLLVFKPMRSRQQLFRMLADTVEAGIVLHSGGRILYANPAVERLTGYTHDELLNLDYWQLAHPDSRAEVQRRAERRLNGEVFPDHLDVCINAKNNRESWVQSSAATIEYEGGRAVLATYIDLTERKRAEAALRDVQNDLERLVHSRTTELEEANRRLAEDVQRRQETEAELWRRNAELTELNGRLGEAQNQLLQNEKMASIGQLAAGVAHEINNPIGYVHSNIGSLEGYLADLFRVLDSYDAAAAQLPDDLPALARLRRIKTELDLPFLRQDIPALMAESKEGITRVRKIVQDLKDFSHQESDEEWKWADLHKGLDSTLNVVHNEIKYKADVVKSYSDLPEIECLPSELNQVFMNLLVNAAHAIADDKRGRITVSTGADGEQVWVEVADTGAGITPENLKRIFDPFFTTKPVGKGTGLGLSLSFGIVQKHGGHIDVDSELGKGTRFRVILPVARAQEEAPI